MDKEEKLDWIILHLRYTQALCEIILETQAEILSNKGKPVSKEALIIEVKQRVGDI